MARSFLPASPKTKSAMRHHPRQAQQKRFSTSAKTTITTTIAIPAATIPRNTMSLPSARTRKRTLSGRTNASEANTTATSTARSLPSARSISSSHSQARTGAIESRGTQTMSSGYRPFTAEDRSLTRRTPREPLVKRWIKFDDQQETRTFRRTQTPMAFQAMELDNEKMQEIAADFVARNEHRLHAFHPAYYKADPVELVEHLTSDKSNFARNMWRLEDKERKLDLGVDSSRIKMCMSSDRESVHKVNDPSIASLTTSREERADRLMRLFTPSYTGRDTRYNRTKGTIPEYGNFSSFVDVINRNKNAVLNR